ncbi:hypothetical protein SAICODRAFT_30419 [Saitoella complicata NRRL Y-17804]|uniref:Uncharacterized protein n=1 Tax=Saitoella complicata (strain BCRC 22490 / CBS 7301 / JCM 7358 / NBRC 10748 / NRRL Y-17804) TaxID=698492 RepID=A0A0E9NHY1_SAICN|nr:uncharacterized protein SAICODRAFT_30419 [Saitoella complicata NRRL Y-17804]ODQ53018.1 hypothetical protein SAICODRAFT_30419 [Saitoella complicata NRRL Y-17804]GAO49015.1 hypothetical protein G7K_3176-t1 [Saitoella complicata NRRL Y-17804]
MLRHPSRPFHGAIYRSSIIPSSPRTYLIRAMSSNSSDPTIATTPNNAATDGPQETTQQKPILALPDKETATPTHKLNLSTGSANVKLDHLGPIIVNTDGTISRIANWDILSEFEKRSALRVIGKRNRERRDVLAAAGVEAGEKKEE